MTQMTADDFSACAAADGSDDDGGSPQRRRGTQRTTELTIPARPGDTKGHKGFTVEKQRNPQISKITPINERLRVTAEPQMIFQHARRQTGATTTGE